MQSLITDAVEAVIFPGGFGAAKNLSTFGVSGEPVVDEEVARVLKEFNEAGKPIAMCCIAPIIAAMVFGQDKPMKLTLGRRQKTDDETGDWPFAGTIDKAAGMGAEVVEAGVDEVVVDEGNKLVTNPAFMYSGPFHEIHDGVAKMVQTLVDLI